MSISTGTTGFTFPHDPLTPLDPTSDPTAAAVHQLRLELYTNARSVHTDFGFGDMGYLGVLMPPLEYLALSGGIAYIQPGRPDIPGYAGVEDRGEMQEMRELYNEETRTYNEARAFTNSIKKLMVNAIPSIFLGRLHDRQHGLANVSPQAMLQHLMTEYGAIDEDARTANVAQLSAPWDPSTPLATVFRNADLCQSFALDGGEPINDTTYIRTTLIVLKNSGVFDDAITHWRNKPLAQHTVTNLVAHFSKFDKFRKADQPLKDSLAALTVKTRAPASTPKPAPPKPGPPAPFTGGSDLTKWVYCWSHGLGIGGHSSANCNRPYPGHCKEATLENRMGGVNKIKGQKGDPFPYQPPPRTPKPNGK
jgi:hypothetical protein